MLNIQSVSAVLFSLLMVLSISVGGVSLAGANHGETVTVQEDDTLRITDITRQQSIVNTNQTTKIRYRIDNTGASDKTVQPDIAVHGGEVVDYHAGSAGPPTYTIPAEESIVVMTTIKFNQTTESYEAANPDTTRLDISLDSTSDIKVLNYTVSDSATTYKTSLEPTGERNQVTKPITVYKDQYENTDNPNYDESIPPVARSGDSFESTASGNLYQFSNAQNDNAVPLVMESVNDELNIGVGIENVPTERHYAIQLNYELVQGGVVNMDVMRADGTEVDENTTYQLGSTDRRTSYYRFSDKETEYISNQNEIYLVFQNNQSVETELEVNHASTISSHYPTVSEQAQYQNLQFETADGNTDYSKEEKIPLQVTYTNNGDHYKTQQVELFRNSRLIERKNITVSPGHTNTLDLPQYVENDGVYEYRVNDETVSVVVGNGSGSASNGEPVADIGLDEYVKQTGSMYEADAVFVDGSGTIHIDTGQDITFTGSDSYHTHPDKSISQYRWSVNGVSQSASENYTTSWSGTGEHNIVLEVEGPDGETSVISRTVKVGSTSPDASFDYTPDNPSSGQQIDFNAGASTHPSQADSSLTYEWQFGDGTVKTTDNPLYRYSYNAGGTYDVTLTVTDDYGNEDVTTGTVSVGETDILADFTWEPFKPQINETVSFDAFRSEAKNDDETIVEYNWDVSGTDYTRETTALNHTFDTRGEKSVTLEVVTNNGKTESVTKEIQIIGKEFEVITNETVKNGTTNTTFDFDATLTHDPEGQIEEWKWDMGDGTVYEYGSETGPTVNHRYSEEGVYTVNVSARGQGYEDSEQITVEVRDDPIAEAGPNMRQAYISGFDFNANASEAIGQNNQIEEYTWEFGDGNTTTTTNDTITYRYSEPGEYKVNLTVTDSNGRTGNDSLVARYYKVPPVAIITDDSSDTAEENINDTTRSTQVGEQVTLYGHQSYDPSEDNVTVSEWEWELPSGETVSQKNVTTSHEQTGEYEYQLTVTDLFGQTDTTTVTLDVFQSIDPEWDAYDVYVNSSGSTERQLMTNEVLAQNVEYEFNATATDEQDANVSYEWDMGDGTTYSSQVTTHTFASAGTYPVTVETYVDGNIVGSNTKNIEVQKESDKEFYYKHGTEYVPWSEDTNAAMGGGKAQKLNSRMYLKSDAQFQDSAREYQSNSVNLTNIKEVEVKYKVEIRPGRELIKQEFTQGNSTHSVDVSNANSAVVQAYGGGGSEAFQRNNSYGGDGGYIKANVDVSSLDTLNVWVGEGGVGRSSDRPGRFRGGHGRHDGGDGKLYVWTVGGHGGASTEIYTPGMSKDEFIVAAHGGGGAGDYNNTYYRQNTVQRIGGGGGGAGGAGQGASQDGEGTGLGGDGGYGLTDGEPGGQEAGQYVTSVIEEQTGGANNGAHPADSSFAQADGGNGWAVVEYQGGVVDPSGTVGGFDFSAGSASGGISYSGNYTYYGTQTILTSDVSGNHPIELKATSQNENYGITELEITEVYGVKADNSVSNIEGDESNWSATDSNQQWDHSNGELTFTQGFESQNYAYQTDLSTNAGYKLTFDASLPETFSESARVKLKNGSNVIIRGEVENDAYNGYSGAARFTYSGSDYRDQLSGDWQTNDWIDVTVWYDPKNGHCEMRAEQNGDTITLDESFNSNCMTGASADDVDSVELGGWSDSGNGISYRNINVTQYSSG